VLHVILLPNAIVQKVQGPFCIHQQCNVLLTVLYYSSLTAV